MRKIYFFCRVLIFALFDVPLFGCVRLCDCFFPRSEISNINTASTTRPTMVKLCKFMALSSLPSLFPSSPQQALGLFIWTRTRNHSSSLFSLSRRSFLLGTLPTLQMTTMASSSTLPTEQSVNQALQLLNSVYGPANSPDFPLPMRSSEAGPCQCVWGTSTHPREQHRYLWTDAFALLAYQTLTEYYADQKNEKEAKMYQDAVKNLISVVHDCLGNPRSGRDEDGMTSCDISPTGHVGLRIGKVCSVLVRKAPHFYHDLFITTNCPPDISQK